MKLLIGLDDTDNLESRGTGFLARQLASLIERSLLGEVKGITRHQLFVHDDIAYTSQNSSACLMVECEKAAELKQRCREFIIQSAAIGSDAGLCISEWEKVNNDIINWGERAKIEVLQLEEAIALSSSLGIYLEGFTGTKIGQIGALAAIGLRTGGDDGRFIWLKGSGELRDFDSGIYSVKDLKSKAGIDVVRDLSGIEPGSSEYINCDGWTRPVLLQNNSVLLVEKINFADYGWKTISKDFIRKTH